MRLLVLLAAFVPGVVLGQSTPPDSTEAAVADSAAAPAVSRWAAFSALADSVRRETPKPELEPAPVVLTPTLHVVGTAGLSLLLPAGWDGPVSAVEVDFPGYGLYSARNDTPGHPLSGVVLRIERVTGLNPLLRERFTRGQTTYGYHGATPIGPAAVPDGLGIEVSGPGTGGAVAFIARGAVLWAVSIQAPSDTWAAHRADVLAVLSSPRLP